MSVRLLGFVLLIWFPGVLYAQSAALPCAAPSLKDGYFVPVKQTYAHGTALTYACDKGYKPVVDSWWATSTCQNGIWSHEPQCIDKNACIPPTIPNANYQQKPNDWYEEGFKVMIICDTGYEAKDHKVMAQCSNGTWSSVPVCERSSSGSVSNERETEPLITTISNCGEAPRVEDAEIVETSGMYLKYQCNDFYKRVGPETVVCFGNDTWSETPFCEARFCSVDTDGYSELKPVGVKYLKDGETVRLECVKLQHWWVDHFSEGRCTDGIINLSRCCNKFQLKTNLC